MEGTLIVVKTGKGELKARIEYFTENSDKKKVVHLGDSPYPLEKNASPCTFEIDANGGAEVQTLGGVQVRTDPAAFGHCHVSEGRIAPAPYNFIPFADPVLEVDEGEDFSRFDPGRCTGCLHLRLEPQRPLFIRDRGGSESFFQLQDRPWIPGSSIRGMVRSLVEVVTWSAPDAVNDRHLYHRAMADKCHRHRNAYQSSISLGDFRSSAEGLEIRSEGGLLKKVGSRYYIQPASRLPAGDRTAASVFRVERRVLAGAGIDDKKKRTQKIFFRPEPREVHPHGKGKFYLTYAATTKVSTRPQKGLVPGHLIISGHMPKKHLHWIIPADPDPAAGFLEIQPRDIYSYQEDRERRIPFDHGKDLLEMLDGGQTGVPCFFVRDGGRIRFGHTGMFRMAYHRATGDLLGPGANELDFARRLFGFVDHQAMRQKAGRVWFEDGRPTADFRFREEPVVETILSGPKPTTFQHYLMQPSDDLQALRHYDDPDARLRGFKRYWHRSRAGAPAAEKSNVSVRFKPITVTGGAFVSRIRFENLRKEELGALLFVLNLPDGLSHHIGMAKPYGYGSVRSSARVSIFDLDRRHAGFSMGLNGTGDVLPGGDESHFIDRFNAWMIRELGRSQPEMSISDLWDHPRLRELAAMLEMPPANEGQWDADRRYLPISPNEYKDRRVLPMPTQVLEKA